MYIHKLLYQFLCAYITSIYNMLLRSQIPACIYTSSLLCRIAGLDHIGTIEVGKRADLLLFDKELNLQETIIAGRTVFEREK